MLLLVNAAGDILLQKRPASGIWGGLWSLPEFDSEKELERWLCRHGYSAEISGIQRGSELKHTFSHYQLTITPYLLKLPLSIAEPANSEKSGSWIGQSKLAQVGVPRPVEWLLGRLESGWK
jgi:A/G-specific adenine glycosylase